MSSELPVCKNCDAVLENDFCGECGQQGKEVRRPVIGLVQDVLVDTLALDSRLFRSVGLLLLWPGRLARLYLDGKRASHTAPFRLYLFTSLFYFLALFASLSSEISNWQPDRNGDILGGVSTPAEDADLPAGTGEEDAVPDEMGGELIPGEIGDLAEGAAPPGGDAPGDERDAEEEGNGFNTGYAPLDAIGPRMEEAVERISQDPRLFMAQLRDNVPRIMLAAPIVYGLLLAIVYIYRRRFYFYDHLVVSLYMHSALYAYLLIALALTYVPGGGWFAWIPLAWGSIQPFAVLKQVYRSPWYSVLLKGTVTNSIYLIVVLVLIVFGLGYAVYLS